MNVDTIPPPPLITSTLQEPLPQEALPENTPEITELIITDEPTFTNPPINITTTSSPMQKTTPTEVLSKGGAAMDVEDDSDSEDEKFGEWCEEVARENKEQDERYEAE